MKIKSLREHYTTKDKGKTWIPKKPFDNEDEVRANKLHDNRWFSYTCGVCGKLHVSKSTNKLKERVNVN